MFCHFAVHVLVRTKFDSIHGRIQNEGWWFLLFLQSFCSTINIAFYSWTLLYSKWKYLLFFWLAPTQERSHKGPTNSFTSSSPEPGRSETRHRWDISNGSDLLCGVTYTNVSINVYIVTLPWQHIHSNKILLLYSFIKDKHLIYLLMVYPSRPINQQLLISTLFPIWLRLRPQQLS